jgi:hypothetical protein
MSNFTLDGELDRLRLLKDAEHCVREAAADPQQLTAEEKEILREIAIVAHRLLWNTPGKRR